MWREVDPAIITPPALVGKNLEDFEKLNKVLEPNRITLCTSREKEWLFTLWGSDGIPSFFFHLCFILLVIYFLYLTRPVVLILACFCAVFSRTEALKRKTAKAEAARREAEARARAEASVSAIVTADASGSVKEKTPEVSHPAAVIEKTSEAQEVSASEAGRKRTRSDGSFEVRPSVPNWSVLSTDSIAILAPDRIKDISGDLCRSQVLPADKRTYESATALQACEQLMCFLFFGKLCRFSCLYL